jgi:uncharacterized membrane protein
MTAPRSMAWSAESMRPGSGRWSVSSILLVLFGIDLLFMGVYFVFLRPPLLPEDLRYTGASQAQLEAVAPRLTAWLSQVFRVMGGFVSATGILTIALAATLFRSHHRGIGFAAAIAGLVSIGLMAAVNFRIGSDFRWVLLGAALLWACSMALFWIETLRQEAGKTEGDLKTRAGVGTMPEAVQTQRRFERHYAATVTLNAPAEKVFSYGDDFSRLSSHMNKSSMMMVGGSMKTSFDAARGQAIGSRVSMEGRMMGMELSLEEIVTERVPPRHKAWETVGAPRLLVIGGYRLGFDIVSNDDTSDLRVFIDYDLPPSSATRWLGYLFGPIYARWCIRQMVDGARDFFA